MVGVKCLVVLWLHVAALVSTAAGQGFALRPVDRTDYLRRLHGMWLGQCIANWTGIRTEGSRINPPFYTDADWGTTPPCCMPIIFVTNQNPNWADDDTDIEYVYLHLMQQHGRVQLSPEELTQGWLTHMNPSFLWVSNRRAYDLMLKGVRPPATGLVVPNRDAFMIDAQLTTEVYGALCPGMPDQAMRWADLSVRTTSASYATHAAQFYIALYSLATQIPDGLSGREQAIWLVQQARRWIPDTSKAADIADFVLSEFLANPDVDNWELTRDQIYQRYHGNAAANGFVYRGWPESSVNFASGVMCLLYGQMDYKRTVQIGTLSGWDSDNCTATMGGLLGLVQGIDGVQAAFPGMSFSDRFWILRTRLNLPDYLLSDPAAEDTLLMMSQRMIPLVDWTIVSAGGTIDQPNQRWVPPAAIPGLAAVELVPTQAEWRRSANNHVRAAGGTVQASCSVSTSPWTPSTTYGSGITTVIANGFESDWTGRDNQDFRRGFFTSQNVDSPPPPNTSVSLQVTYDREIEVASIRFIEGDHFGPTFGSPAGIEGGWLTSASVELQVAQNWVPVPVALSEPLDALRPFQIIDFVLHVPVHATGIRLFGLPGGANRFFTCAELDAFRLHGVCAADFNGDDEVDFFDYLDFVDDFSANEPAADFNGDTLIDFFDYLDFVDAFSSGC